MFKKGDKVVLESGGQIYKVHDSDEIYTWVIPMDTPLRGDNWIPKRYLTKNFIKL